MGPIWVRVARLFYETVGVSFHLENSAMTAGRIRRGRRMAASGCLLPPMCIRDRADTQRWFDEVGSLVGPTTILFYPHGERPDGNDWQNTGPVFQYLQSQGFRVFASVGIESFSYIKKDLCAVICDRLHPDGTTLRHSRDRYLQFYDAKDIMDVTVRPQRELSLIHIWGTSGKGTGAAAAFVPAGASNSGFSRLLRTAETTSRPICARPVRLLWRAGFARWVCSSKRVAAATFLRSQGNRCRPVLILSFFCCSFLSGFLLYYGHRQKSTERNIRSCAVLPHCCLRCV